jgi:hypothetical protein
MSGAFSVSMRFVPGPQRGVGTRELRRRGRPVPSARSRSGLAAVGEDIKLARPGKSHPVVNHPGWYRPAGRRMTWTAAAQPALLQSAESVGESQRTSPDGRVVPGASAGSALRGQCRYFFAEELAGHPDHGGCGWVEWYARADRGTDTAPEECGRCLAGELAM